MLKHLFLAIVSFQACYTHADSDSYHSGRCPPIEPFPDFNMAKFLGKWYAIEKTLSSSPCISYEISLGEHPGFFEIQQTSKISDTKNKYHYAGDVLASDVESPANMRIIFPFSIKSSKFIVFDTDYENYAAVFICQEFKVFHRFSVVVLSRQRTLKMEYREQIHFFLSRNATLTRNLDRIDQSSCLGNGATTEEPEIDAVEFVDKDLPLFTTPRTDPIDTETFKPIIPVGSPKRRTTRRPTTRPSMRDIEYIEEKAEAEDEDASISVEQTDGDEIDLELFDDGDPSTFVVLIFS